MELGIAMSIMENHENIWDQTHQDNSEIDSSHSSKVEQSSNSTSALAQAKEKLILFISELQEYRKSDIRSDVLQHCEQINRNKKVVAAYISDEAILRIVTSRIEKMIKNKKIKKNWSEEDVKILVWVVSKYCDKNIIANIDKDISLEDWQRIAQLIPGVTANSCMFKWLSIRKVNLSSCSWDEHESDLLREIIHQKQLHGKLVNKFTNFNWKLIAEELYFLNNHNSKVFRSAKQCREHWNCFLNPKLKKGPWLTEEDIQLLSLIKSNNGEKKWSEIVFSFEGRTENALKNRYTLLIDKQKRISKSKQELALIEDCLQRCYEEQLKGTHYRNEVVMYPIGEEHQESRARNDHFEVIDSNESKEMSFVQRSEENTPSSGCSTPKKLHSNIEIKFVKSSDQLELLEFFRSRNMKKCCLKNGSYELEQ